MLSDEGLCWLLTEGIDKLPEDGMESILDRMQDMFSFCTDLSTYEDMAERTVAYILLRKWTDPADLHLLLQWADECVSSLDYRVPDATVLSGFVNKSFDYYHKKPVGCFLASLSLKRVKDLPEKTIAPINCTIHGRLRLICCKFAEKCTYERTGDSFIHGVLRSKLPAWSCALLPFNTPGYDAIAEEFPDTANDLVRPFFETQPTTQCTTFDWDNDFSVGFLYFIAGVLRECLDFSDVPVFSNTDIPRGIRKGDPFIFSVDSTITICKDGDMAGVFHESCLNTVLFGTRPVTTILYYYLKACTSSSNKNLREGCSQVLLALSDPESMSSRNPCIALREELLRV